LESQQVYSKLKGHNEKSILVPLVLSELRVPALEFNVLIVIHGPAIGDPLLGQVAFDPPVNLLLLGVLFLLLFVGCIG